MMANTSIKVGDIVRRNDGQNLRSGAEMYGAAICVSLAPFVLVSEHADMRWESTVSIEDFHTTGQVDADHLKLAMRRLND
ncbi:hypothetical protein [Ralstonia phage RP13]|nr:hypothetical protein [Ralstonia phage RP13]